MVLKKTYVREVAVKNRRIKRIPPNMRRPGKRINNRKLGAFFGIMACFVLAIVIAFAPGEDKNVINN